MSIMKPVTLKGSIIILALVMLLGQLSTGSYASTATMSATVTLKTFAKVYGNKIELGELARIQSSDESLRLALESVVVGTAPWPGNIKVMELGRIKMRLRQRNIDTALIEFEGPASIQVMSRFNEVKGERILDVARDYIFEQMPWNPDDVQLDFARMPKNVQVPDVEYDFVPSILSAHAYKGNIQISVGIRINDQTFLTIPVVARLRVFQEVVVAKRKIYRNEAISADDVWIRKKEITRLNQNAIHDIEDVLNKRATRVIPANKILTENVVDDPYLIRRGDVVSILIENEYLEIKTIGKAEQSGRSGDVIRVSNSRSKKVLFGTVVDSRTVKIQTNR